MTDTIQDAQIFEPSQRPERAGQRARQLVGVQLPARAQDDSDRGHAREPRGQPRHFQLLASCKQKKTKHSNRQSVWVVTRAAALTDRTATHRYMSVASDPSDLGSEPESWLECRYLRVRKKIQIVGTREPRAGAAMPLSGGDVTPNRIRQ